MLIEKEFDKPYPESPECEVNDRDCEFDADSVCHDCGTVLCSSCAIGVRHQPQLAKYEKPDGAGTDPTQLHCPDCIDKHALDYRMVGVGTGSVALALLLLVTSGASSVPLALIALLLLVIGAAVLRKEYLLKEPQNQEYNILDMR